MKTILVLLGLSFYLNYDIWDKEITKNEMTVSWKYVDERIHFEMMAPTTGWVTIGFNATTGMSKAYLLMGRVVEGKAEVVEHYTISPGNYKPITALGAQSVVKNVKGIEKDKRTTLQFSIPIEAENKYARHLIKGSEYLMTLAFSREDDFMHHSMMRTSINVKL